MSFIQALVLGILQGLTEFLPVSSSAHLVLVPWILGWSEPEVTFDIVLHFGTVLAIAAVFWRDIIRLLVGFVNALLRPRDLTTDGRLALLLILSAIPAAFMGVVLNDFFEALFGSPRLVAVLLFVTGLILWFSERFATRRRALAALTWKDALVMGLAQGIAIAPGISRSGATLAAGLLRGLRREDTARFAFLMSVPVIVGAAGYKVLKTPLQDLQVGLLAVGLSSAAVVGYLVIRAFLGYVRNRSLKPFALYCTIAGTIAFALSFILA